MRPTGRQSNRQRLAVTSTKTGATLSREPRRISRNVESTFLPASNGANPAAWNSAFACNILRRGSRFSRCVSPVDEDKWRFFRLPGVVKNDKAAASLGRRCLVVRPLDDYALARVEAMGLDFLSTSAD